MQGPRKAAQLRFRKSPCTVCLPLQPESDRLMLAQLQCHLNCAVDVPQSWSGLQLTMMVSPMATSVKCPVYKQEGKRQLLSGKTKTFFSILSLYSGPPSTYRHLIHLIVAAHFCCLPVCLSLFFPSLQKAPFTISQCNRQLP